jgi:hypothetical protein
MLADRRWICLLSVNTAAVLAAVCSALSERRLVIVGVPNLSALAGARAGMVGVTLSVNK